MAFRFKVLAKFWKMVKLLLLDTAAQPLSIDDRSCCSIGLNIPNLAKVDVSKMLGSRSSPCILCNCLNLFYEYNVYKYLICAGSSFFRPGLLPQKTWFAQSGNFKALTTSDAKFLLLSGDDF
jgi:hypothetical protein